MAFAASQYTFRQQEFKKYGAEASPAHVRELLDEIRKSARRLSRALWKTGLDHFHGADLAKRAGRKKSYIRFQRSIVG